MKNLLLVLSVFGLLFTNVQAEPFPIDELDKMVTRDQSLREKWISAEDPDTKNKISKEIRIQEIELTERLKVILSEYGMPPEDAISDAFQLILRSSDVGFQKKILERILPLENSDWVECVPLLVDRILLREGMPQRFGTHFFTKDDSVVSYPIENLDEIDALREEFDMEPLQEYMEEMSLIYPRIKQNGAQILQKILFNKNNNFYGDPDDYLYYVIPCCLTGWYSATEGEILADINPKINIAFEHPAHAAIYALRSLGVEYEIEEDNKFSDDDFEDYFTVKYKDPTPRSPFDWVNFSFDFPCHVFLVPRKNFQPFQYEDQLFHKIYLSEKNVEAIAEFKSKDFLDLLVTLGKTIEIERGGDGLSMRIETSGCYHIFDSTLENEDFEVNVVN